MRIAVVGDALLDVDVEGSASRLCPDAPVPVLDVEREVVRPGGAALATSFLCEDGVDVTLVTALAADADGERLRDALRSMDVVAAPAESTVVKTRLRCDGTSLARLDRGGGGAPRATDDMLDAVLSADLVLVSDYGRGLVRDERLRSVLERVPVVWDPHPRGPAPVPDTRLVTPNLTEARKLSGCARPEDAACALRDRWRSRAVVVTLGADGALLCGGGTPVAVPAPRVVATDTCGAGDRFAATVSARLAAGSALDDAVGAAVVSAADFVSGGRSGATGVSVVDSVRARGGVVVATGGCFDVLHAGHVRMLRAARAMGDCLVVCLNSDTSVRRLKGPHRPVNGQDERAEVLRALGCVDEVVVFGESTPEQVLGTIRPDVWVKGGDYSAESLPEAAVVRRWGGRTVVVPYHQGLSTTEILARRA
jgi:rfaE bifunctional protein nucleotidyltransferase chain/domain/rfaE bifunctional protein kinase chain/domain